MRAKHLKATMLAIAAIALSALASPSLGKSYTYTFGNGSGSAYCDGTTFTNDGSKTWSGTHLGSCVPNSDVAGFTIRGETTDTIELSMADPNFPNAFDTFLIQPKTLLWYVYIDMGYGFFLANDGNLIKGAPPISRHSAKSAVFKNPMVIDKPVL
jgi:hypothetical protein